MLRIGPHVSKEDLLKWVGDGVYPWKAVQMFAGYPGSYVVDWDLRKEVSAKVRLETSVVVHGCYMAYCNNKPESEKRAKSHIKDAMMWTAVHEWEYYLVHTGATKGKEIDQIVKATQDFDKWLESLQEEFAKQGLKKPKCLIENVAACYPANNSEKVLDAIVEGRPNIGLCIDTAHAYAAGWEDGQIVERIEKYRPEVVHLNAPASYIERGCGRDRHGWWYDEKTKDLLSRILAVVKGYQPVLILEGASEPGDMVREFTYVTEKMEEVCRQEQQKSGHPIGS